MAPSATDRLAGAVWGHLVGDAVGVPYEFRAPDEIGEVTFRGGGSHGQPAGTWSDDGALMLATLDSLLRVLAAGEERFDPADLAARFLAWADERDYTPDGDGRFDIGITTGTALRAIRGGVAPEVAGGTDERHSNGNGSLMRILPLALVERDLDDAELVDHAHRSSAITHGRAWAQAACALNVLVARRLLGGEGRSASLATARSTLRSIYADRPDPEVRLAALDRLEGWSERTGSGFVLDAFWSAWDAFAGAGSYRETIERAVRYGIDTDTTACIAGGLAGLRWGLAGIPADWRAGLRGQDIVEPLVDRLLGREGGSNGRGGSSGQGGSDVTATRTSDAPAGAKTSATDPLRVDWVPAERVPDAAGWNGRLGMTFLPGKHNVYRGGDQWRDLEADLDRLREHWRADTLLLLVEDDELTWAGVPEIETASQRHGIDLVRFPILDMWVPADAGAFAAVTGEIQRRLREGRTVVVACVGGLGRTGTAVGCLLRETGLDARAAIDLTRASRRGTIQSSAQEAFVRAWPVRTP